jgi:hypothetical protein
MEGIRYVITDQGKRTAVLIDWEQLGGLWEDFCDMMLARQRAEEPRELESVRKKLRQQRRLISPSP